MLAEYLRDESRYGPGRADAVLFPTGEEEVAQILARAQERCTPVTVSGGRTGAVGGAVPEGGIVLSLERLNRFLGLIRHPEKEAWLLRLQPGVTLAELNRALKERDLPGLSERELRPFQNQRRGYFYPPDPTEPSCQIGGTVATNASGARSFRYGQTRGYVWGLRVVLPTGEVLSLRRGELLAYGWQASIPLSGRRLSVALPTYEPPPVKNAAGFYSRPDMDLIDLFIGSEGTLGVITEVELVLVPEPAGFMEALAFFPTEEAALAFVAAARRDPELTPSTLEFFDSHSLRLLNAFRHRRDPEIYPPLPEAGAAVLFEQPLLFGGEEEEEEEEILAAWELRLRAHGSSPAATWAGTDPRMRGRLRALRHALPEAVNLLVAENKKACPPVHKLSTDFAVPDQAQEIMFDAYRETYRRLGVEYVVFGHAGQNHLHTNLLPKSETELARCAEAVTELAHLAVSLGGTVSAEHGIGKLKRHLLPLMYGQEGVRQMRELKRALDPNLVLNRGNLFLPD
ncbi:MAG: FAD-binding oxidoreductase [Moorellales bacterium]